ncbi:MAG: hypothetical protein DMG97_23870 [Acidobacteria bacterium]|nr:MAG: hypothetical protein DMG97_23870 [Acidobacteriota bacterium]
MLPPGPPRNQGRRGARVRCGACARRGGCGMTSVLFASRHLLTAVRDSKFVIPTAIPFERLRARELEECVYWLLDSMGAQELVWRVGTQGRSAADSGRDIEAHFHIASPNADLVRQKWWIECKGRKQTVEASATKETANNAQAMPEIDVLVIVTNTTFSNPTRNWVKEWQRSHPRPTVK